MNKMEESYSADVPRSAYKVKADDEQSKRSVEGLEKPISCFMPAELNGLYITSTAQNHARADPPTYRVSTPSVHDVAFGKGGTMHFPGNETFRAECQRLAPEYINDPRTCVRDDLAVELVSIVYNRGGRFVVIDPDDNELWKDAGFELAIKKAKQILGDAKRKAQAKDKLKSHSGKKRGSPETGEKSHKSRKVDVI